MGYSSPAAFLSPIPAIEVNVTKPAGNRNSNLLRSDISDFAALRYFWGHPISIPSMEGIERRTPEVRALRDQCKRGTFAVSRRTRRRFICYENFSGHLDLILFH